MKNQGFGRVLSIVAGMLLVLLGIISLFRPGVTLMWLVVFVGVSVLISGIGHIAAFFLKERLSYHIGWALLMGIVDVLLGILILMFPVVAGATMSLMVGWWALLYGIMRMVLAFQMKRITKRWVYMLVMGILGVVCGIFALILPAAGAVFIGVVTSIFLILAGASLIGDLA